MGATWIEHNGKRILWVKYGGLKPAEMLDLIRTATQLILDEKSDQILSLSDLTDCFVNKDFTELSKEQGAISLPLTKKAAIMGVSGIKSILLKGVNAFAAKPRVPFDTVEEALDWLAK